MSPEYGSTVAMFPVDAMTLDYLRLSGRDEAHVNLVERYTKDQGLFRSDDVDPEYASTLEVDLTAVEPSLAGPRRPQDRVTLSGAKAAFAVALPTLRGGTGKKPRSPRRRRAPNPVTVRSSSQPLPAARTPRTPVS